MLEKALSFDLDNKEYQLLMCTIMMKRGRSKEAYVFLRDLIKAEPLNLLYNTLLSFLYVKYLNDDKLGEKFKRVAERIY